MEPEPPVPGSWLFIPLEPEPPVPSCPLFWQPVTVIAAAPSITFQGASTTLMLTVGEKVPNHVTISCSMPHLKA